MPKRKRTPQEKKRLSLQHDRRDTYGESNKGSRKTVPRKKAIQRRVVRRTDAVALLASTEMSGEDQEPLDPKHQRRLRFWWRKVPSTPLGEVIPPRMAKRKALHGRKQRARNREVGN